MNSTCVWVWPLCGRLGRQLQSLPRSLSGVPDVGMGKEDTKVHLVLALNQDTLACLDTYVTMRGGDEMAHLETVQDQLRCIPYIQM